MGDNHPGRPDGAGPDTGRTGPTDEERAAAADVLSPGRVQPVAAPYGIIEGLAA
jgi:hypothetical protein